MIITSWWMNEVSQKHPYWSCYWYCPSRPEWISHWIFVEFLRRIMTSGIPWRIERWVLWGMQVCPRIEERIWCANNQRGLTHISPGQLLDWWVPALSWAGTPHRVGIWLPRGMIAWWRRVPGPWSIYWWRESIQSSFVARRDVGCSAWSVQTTP